MDDSDINTDCSQFINILLNAIEASTIEHKITNKVSFDKNSLG